VRNVGYIYVSWGIIKLDDKILLCQREDTHKRYDKSAGDYGLIGGRLNQYDIHSFSGDIRNRLRSLQSDNLAHTYESFATTLKRELSEEVGLFFDIHYTFNLWRSLKPYRQIQGSAPNHAYTKYHFEIYHIKLTLEGYLFLKQQLQSNEHLVWFSIDEVVEGKSTDGKIAYVNALINDFDMDKHELKTELFKLQESFIANYSCQPLKPNDYALTIPIISESSIFFGFKGKEKPIDVKLSERQLSILLGLSAHSRRFEFESPSNKIVLHPYNWIEVKNDESLQRELLELVELFQSLPFKIENHKDKLFRLSIDPSIIYFDDKCFLYSVSLNDLKGIKSKIEVSLTRLPMQTAFGVTRLVKEYFNISLKLASGLQDLSDKSSPSDNPKAEKIEDNYSKTILKEARFQSLGLKNLVRREKGLIKFCVNIAKI
jgi:8-oxo-dGTP pyrophosphatase MutT (NUDIX family)